MAKSISEDPEQRKKIEKEIADMEAAIDKLRTEISIIDTELINSDKLPPATKDSKIKDKDDKNKKLEVLINERVDLSNRYTYDNGTRFEYFNNIDEKRSKVSVLLYGIIQRDGTIIENRPIAESPVKKYKKGDDGTDSLVYVTESLKRQLIIDNIDLIRSQYGVLIDPKNVTERTDKSQLPSVKILEAAAKKVISTSKEALDPTTQAVIDQTWKSNNSGFGKKEKGPLIIVQGSNTINAQNLLNTDPNNPLAVRNNKPYSLEQMNRDTIVSNVKQKNSLIKRSKEPTLKQSTKDIITERIKKLDTLITEEITQYNTNYPKTPITLTEINKSIQDTTKPSEPANTNLTPNTVIEGYDPKAKENLINSNQSTYNTNNSSKYTNPKTQFSGEVQNTINNNKVVEQQPINTQPPTNLVTNKYNSSTIATGLSNVMNSVDTKNLYNSTNQAGAPAASSPTAVLTAENTKNTNLPDNLPASAASTGSIGFDKAILNNQPVKPTGRDNNIKSVNPNASVVKQNSISTNTAKEILKDQSTTAIQNTLKETNLTTNKILEKNGSVASKLLQSGPVGVTEVTKVQPNAQILTDNTQKIKDTPIIENIKTDEAKPDLIDYSQYFAQMINYNSAIYDLLSNKLRVTVVS